MKRTFERGVGIAAFLSVLSIVARHCACLTCCLHPRLRKRNAVLISPQLLTLRRQRRLRRACGGQEAFPLGVVAASRHRDMGGRGNCKFTDTSTGDGKITGNVRKLEWQNLVPRKSRKNS